MILEMQHDLESPAYSNFTGLFVEEKGFGDAVAADLKAYQDAQTKKGLTKTAKAGLAVGIAAVLIVGGFIAYKKMNK